MSLPTIPQIECVETRDNYGRFVAEPMEKGFGVTLGNALRRVMLGHLPGAAITRVRIDGIQHEFSPIPNVREDVIEFLLNVKEIRLKPTADRPGRLIMDIAGEGRICAADINPTSDFEVANPELYLATTNSPEAKLFIEFDVEIGEGYAEAESGDNLPLGVIPVAAIFTPVRKVNYTIEPLHIGEETSHERLNIEIWTDRTIEPGEAMIRSASILMSILNAFVNYGTAVQVEAEKEYAELAMSEEQYNMPVEQLSLSVRTMNCLRRGSISTVGELISRGEKGLLALRNFGQKSKLEIEERLNEVGLSLNPVTEETEEPADEDTEDMMAVTAEAMTSGDEDATEQGESPEEEQ